MNSPSPAIRCLSCGYDVASLIAQRGRDEPGVCPECGARLQSQLHNPCPYEAQHAWSVRGHLRWICDSLVRPSKVARLTYLPAAGKMMKWNALAAAAVFAATAMGFAVPAFFKLDIEAIAMWIAIAVVGAAVTWLVSWITAYAIGGTFVVAGRMGRGTPSWTTTFGALDIFTAWLTLWPLVLPLELGRLFLLFGGASIRNNTIETVIGIVGIWLLAPALSLIVGPFSLVRIARCIDSHTVPPTSKPPSPSNLR